MNDSDPMSDESAAPTLDRAALNIPHESPFVCRLVVNESHLGRAIPHVSNVEYVRWLDRAAELHSDSLGYTRANLEAARIMWFVARHEVDYMAECWLNDELLIATWVRDIARVRSWRDFVIVRRTDQRVVCRASTLWVLVDLETRRPRRIPADMISVFKPLHFANQGAPSCTSP